MEEPALIDDDNDDVLDTDLAGANQELLAQLLLLEVSEIAKVLICILRVHPALMALLKYLEANGSFQLDLQMQKAKELQLIGESAQTENAESISEGDHISDENYTDVDNAESLIEGNHNSDENNTDVIGYDEQTSQVKVPIIVESSQISRGPFMDTFRKARDLQPRPKPNQDLQAKKENLKQGGGQKTLAEPVERVGNFFENTDLLLYESAGKKTPTAPVKTLVRKQMNAAGEKFDPQGIYGTQPVKHAKPHIVFQEGSDGSLTNPDLKHITPQMRQETLPIIQLGSHTYFCEEDESSVTIEIYRHGPANMISSVYFETRDLTAKAGIRYHRTTAVVKFGKGDHVKEVKVPIMDNHSFDSTLEFDVYLSHPTNAVLGRYLYRCSVKIIDDETFPTDRFHDLILAGKIHSIPDHLLFLEYCKLNFQQPIIRQGTKFSWVVDQLHNLYFIWQLNMTRYLIDKVVNLEEDPENLPISGRRDMVLVVMMMFIVAPLGGLHFLEVKRLTWKVGGCSRALLRNHLLRKFFNYDEETRCKMQQSELIMAMTRDTDEVVDMGYSKTIPLVKDLGRLGLILLQQVLMPLAYFEMPDSTSVLTFLIFPILMIVFLTKRTEITNHSTKCFHLRENAMVANTQEAILNYRLIADYNKQPHYLRTCEEAIAKLNAAIVDAGIVRCNNRYFAKWIATIVVGLYTLYGGWKVITGKMLLGDFIVNIQIYKEIGISWGDVYDHVLDMQSCIPALRNITSFMSHPVDVRRRMTLTRQRNQYGRKSLNACEAMARRSTATHIAFAIDFMPIQIVNMNFSFDQLPDADALRTHGKGITATFEVKQGTMVALTCQRSGGGKTTLLKVLGGLLLPDAGVNIPPHLRVLHISEQPLFFEGTLKKNLLFGVVDCVHESHTNDESLDRVVAICRKLLVPESLITQILDEHDIVDDFREEFVYWGSVLSLTQRASLHLARALIANPDVLCLHRPTRAFDRGMPEFMNTLNVLREFVDQRGVEQDPSTLYHRRPRSCIVTAGRAANVGVFDAVFQVDGTNGVTKVEVEAPSPKSP
eukprot:gnl/MRDRNA2_/MRDRNA2_86357_c0_seq1.p1 gnl/MRDRNA2_/MRDRNA2_86357_c0~~gnl/MRDRNA2_/MRDRNA2_86357_c0_seq1.p1  ORF type:complete len:1049 (-),score=171.30 gnl/MRDRNA2_/MRDRNA2_86357_c0_seq1:95-3241(-)